MRRQATIIGLVLALVLALGWGLYQYKERIDYHTYLDIQFQRQFYELIGHVENAQVNLAKAIISASNKDVAQFLNTTASQSYMAQEKLTQLPFHHGGIRGTEKFLSQLGDYCSAMTNKTLEGISLNEKELKTMADLHDNISHLSGELIKLQQRVVAGGVNFGDLRREGNIGLSRLEEELADFNLISFEERIQEYPELIYDGPFSDHLRDKKPKLRGEEIGQDQAVDVVLRAFPDHKNSQVRVTGTSKNQAIDSYYISISDGNREEGYEITAAVSKIAGKLVWYMDPILGGASKISREEAVKKAEDFLEEIGYKNMKLTYSMAYEGQIVINFAYQEGDVLIYSDLVKLKLALDDGRVIGLEAEGYLANHQERNIEEAKISEEEAREKLSSGVQEEGVRLAIIPIEGGKELLTYEFKVKFGRDTYLIYIDANTGVQRKILLMVEDKAGTLVI